MIDHPDQKKKINKKSYSDKTVDQMYLTNMYRIFHPRTAEYTFFSEVHEIFSK
jgi:exonuclease III